MHKRKMNFTNLTTFFIISFSNSDLFIQLTFEKNKTSSGDEIQMTATPFEFLAPIPAPFEFWRLFQLHWNFSTKILSHPMPF